MFSSLSPCGCHTLTSAHSLTLTFVSTHVPLGARRDAVPIQKEPLTIFDEEDVTFFPVRRLATMLFLFVFAVVCFVFCVPYFV